MQNLITQHLDIWTAAHKTRSSAGRGSSQKLDLVGIKKLRQLILELAVTGKLIPKDHYDIPASELLEKYETERKALIKEGLLKKDKQAQEDILDSFESEFPSNWRAVTFRKVGNWAIGNGFPEVEQGNTSGEYLFCKVSDMNLPGNEKFITSTAHTVTSEAAERLKLKLHPEGTVIFPKIGGAIATNKRRLLIQPTAIDNNCLGLTPNQTIYSEYLYIYIVYYEI